jgi:hypothetical protein
MKCQLDLGLGPLPSTPLPNPKSSWHFILFHFNKHFTTFCAIFGLIGSLAIFLLIDDQPISDAQVGYMHIHGSTLLVRVITA